VQKGFFAIELFLFPALAGGIITSLFQLSTDSTFEEQIPKSDIALYWKEAGITDKLQIALYLLALHRREDKNDY